MNHPLADVLRRELAGLPVGDQLFRLAGALPVRHEHALAAVERMRAAIPPSAFAEAWAHAFAEFVTAETDLERAAARENIRSLHASTFRLHLA